MRALMLVLLLLSACTPQVPMYPGPMKELGNGMYVAVEDSPQGFLIIVEYNAGFGSQAATAAACKNALLSQASAYADRRARTLKPIDEQRITMSVGYRGITPNCLAQLPVEWQ
jgi:hypothetical protein